jgi:regulator of nonsense transcripts 2
MRGVVSDKFAIEAKYLRMSCDALHEHMMGLCQVLDKDVALIPVLEQEEEDDFNVIVSMESSEILQEESMYDDLEMQQLYEDLPNLLRMVSPKLLGLKPEDIPRLEEERNKKLGRAYLNADGDVPDELLNKKKALEKEKASQQKELEKDKKAFAFDEAKAMESMSNADNTTAAAAAALASSSSSSASASGSGAGTGAEDKEVMQSLLRALKEELNLNDKKDKKDKKEDKKEKKDKKDKKDKKEDAIEDDDDKDIPNASEDAAAAASSNAGGASGNVPGNRRLISIDRLIDELYAAKRVETVDELSLQFCYLNKAKHRDRIVEAMYEAPVNQHDLLRLMSRFTATLSQYHEHIGKDLSDLLDKEFSHLQARKLLKDYPLKMRNINFISELTKFRVADCNLVFKCWNTCLLHFVGHNVHIVARMLETCGRWLYMNKKTHLRCHMFLERMMGLLKSRYMDPSLSIMIENAYYCCRPAAAGVFSKAPQRTPIHQYIRKLLYVDLNYLTTDMVLMKLRKLPWDDPTMLPLVLHCMRNVKHIKYTNIAALASVLSGISRYQPIGQSFVDYLLEDIRLGLESNELSQKQPRLTQMKLLGELYAHRMVDNQVIIDTLFLLITFGHQVNSRGLLESHIDPPSDTFRVRLIVTLIDSICMYFLVDSSLKQKTKDFLIYFQRYLYLKQYLPVDLEFSVQATLDRVQSGYQRIPSLQECQRLIDELEGKHRVLLQSQSQSQSQADGGEGGMDDEEDDDDADYDDKQGKANNSNNSNDDNNSFDANLESEEFKDIDESQISSSSSSSSSASASASSEVDAEPEFVDMDEFEYTRGGRGGNADADDTFADEFDKMMEEMNEAANLTALPNKHQNLRQAATFVEMERAEKSGAKQLIVHKDKNDEPVVSFKLLTKVIKASGKVQTLVKEVEVPVETSFATSYVVAEEQRQLDIERLKEMQIRRYHNASFHHTEDWEEELEFMQEVNTDMSHRQLHTGSGNVYSNRQGGGAGAGNNSGSGSHSGGGGGAGPSKTIFNIGEENEFDLFAWGGGTQIENQRNKEKYRKKF